MLSLIDFLRLTGQGARRTALACNAMASKAHRSEVQAPRPTCGRLLGTTAGRFTAMINYTRSVSTLLLFWVRLFWSGRDSALSGPLSLSLQVFTRSVPDFGFVSTCVRADGVGKGRGWRGSGEETGRGSNFIPDDEASSQSPQAVRLRDDTHTLPPLPPFPFPFPRRPRPCRPSRLASITQWKAAASRCSKRAAKYSK